MKTTLKLLAYMALLLPLCVPAKAQLSLFGFNWSMSEIEARDALDYGFKESVGQRFEASSKKLFSNTIDELDIWDTTCANDFEGLQDRLVALGIVLLSCERKQIGPAYLEFMMVQDSRLVPVRAFQNKFWEQQFAGASIEELIASKELYEAFLTIIEYDLSDGLNTEVLFSNDGAVSLTPPESDFVEPLAWACEGERRYDWALNYKGLKGMFCGDGEDQLRWDNLEEKTNEFREPWMAFNCTKFDGCRGDDFYIAEVLFEDPDISKHLAPHPRGRKFDIVDFGLCRRAISGERLCVLNSHIILFKGEYQ